MHIKQLQLTVTNLLQSIVIYLILENSNLMLNKYKINKFIGWFNVTNQQFFITGSKLITPSLNRQLDKLTKSIMYKWLKFYEIDNVTIAEEWLKLAFGFEIRDSNKNQMLI